MSRLRCRPSVGIAFLLVGFEAAAAAADFQHDVRPILAEHCGHCHGPDEAARQGGLRLDDRSAALAGGDSGSPAIMPQDPGRSELIRRVTSTDENVVMPPPDAKKPLSPEQIRTLEAWIAAGAEYSSHWVFVPPRAPTPTGDAPHPIDAFVRNRLEGSGLEPAPPADAATTSPASPAMAARRPSTVFSPARHTANTGRGPGSIWPAIPIPTATRRT